MPTSRELNQVEARGTRRELVGLIRRIQALDQLRRRLANVARRTAADDLGAAA